MSHDNASVFRRKTLGVLDTNNAAMSNIPQPSSVLKKPTTGRMSMMASRPSLAPQRAFSRSSSGGNLQGELRTSGARASHGDSRDSRSSYSQSMRRSSAYVGARSSSIGYASQGSQAPAKDPRPVRDKQYQMQCVRNIVDFLTNSGYPQPVTQKTLTTPTAKDFISIFKWLYSRLDPNYEFAKKIDDEVVTCMKALRYPFADSISRSQLMAIGSPHSWPSMLAMLNWMVDVVCSTEKLLRNRNEFEDGQEAQSDRIFFDYLTKAYRVFLTGDDDFSEMETDLERDFDKRNGRLLAEIEKLEKSNDNLQKEIEELQESHPPLEMLQQDIRVLQSDKDKFRHYIDHLENKRQKLIDCNARLREEIKQKDIEAQDLQAERVDVQRQVDAQDISPADVDRMTAEREQLGRNLDAMVAKMEQASKSAYEKEITMQKRLEGLEMLMTKYNTLGYRIGIIPETAPWANGIHYELDIVNTASSRPDQIVNLDLRHEVKPNLAKLRTDLGARVHREQDEALQLQELLDKVCEGLADKREELESLEAKLTSSIGQYNEVKDNSATEMSATNAEIERLERELHQIKLSAQNGILQLEQRSQALGIEYDQLNHACSSFKEDLYREVWQVLEEIIQFKIYIQKGLEGLEASVCEDAETFKDVTGAE